MRILIQECLKASVRIDGEIVSKIDEGEVIFVGFTQTDDYTIIDKMIEKLLKLRIFADQDGKTNLNLAAHGGKILCVSQFTLYADVSQGNRPSFTSALGGEKAKLLYDYFCQKLLAYREDTLFGVFGADMKVELINDGPFTIMLDSKDVIK